MFALLGPCAILAAILFPVFAQARLAAKRTAAISNLKQISTSAIMYSADNDGHFPIAEHWESQLQKYVGGESVYYDPSSDEPKVKAFAMNSSASMAKSDWIEDPINFAMFFTTALQRPSAQGQLESVRINGGRGLIGFADGSVKATTNETLPSLIWDVTVPEEDSETEPVDPSS